MEARAALLRRGPWGAGDGQLQPQALSLTLPESAAPRGPVEAGPMHDSLLLAAQTTASWLSSHCSGTGPGGLAHAGLVAAPATGSVPRAPATCQMHHLN